jgi:hypothetical protein
MKTEIFILLNTGLTPKKVSETLHIPLSTVYYNRKQWELGKQRLARLNK